MSRPSAHLDRKLVAAARAMLPDVGFTGLSVREVARRAGVNVGMFHYHFKTRNVFLQRVLGEVYQDFLVSFQEAAEGPGAPRERLRRVLVAYAHFGRRNRVFYSMLIRELLNGQPEMIAFARKNFPRHTDAMMRLMKECRRDGVVRDLPAPTLCMFAMSTMGVPNVAATGLERSGQRTLAGRPAKEFIDMVLSDEMIETRADMVLAALCRREAQMMLLSAALAAALAVPARADAPRFALTMAEAESAARAHALDAKAAAEESAAARDLADAAFSPLLPRLTLDGYARYQAEVPKASLVPGAPAAELGTHNSTSIGPTLSWTLWDEGALYKTWKAQKASARSQEEQQRLVETQATEAARLAYVQVQLAREKVLLLADSVVLADAQYADVEKRLRAGAVSRIDSLSSHQEDLQRRKDFLSAQSDLAGALRELFQLTGLGAGLDLTRPVDVRVSTEMPKGLAEPTVRVVLDSLAEVPPALAAAEAAGGPSPDHPGVLIYSRQAESARLSADAVAAGNWPTIQFQGAIDYEYPNLFIPEYVWQKTVGLTASIPLFEDRRTSRRADSQRRLANAAERRRDLQSEELARDWDKARAALAALRDQQALDVEAVVESTELAHLIYLAYQGGRRSYLEVQTYDLTALQAKVAAAQTRAQILIQLATLAQLAAQG